MGKLQRILKLTPSEFLKLFLLISLLACAGLKKKLSSHPTLIKSLKSGASFRELPAINPARTQKLQTWVRLLESADRNLGWKPSCIRRALVLVWLSRIWRIPFEVKIGVRREGTDFEAHTWVETDGMTMEVQPAGAVFLSLQKAS